MLTNKKALITGGSQGIGKAVVLEFAKNNAEIVICARNEKKLESVTREVLNYGLKADYIVCDVSKPEEVKDTVSKTMKILGRIDILANIAGISPKLEGGYKVPFYEIDDETWNRVMGINLNSMFYFSKEVSKHMMKQNYGRMINMSSIVGLTSSEHGPASACYTTSKTGVIGLTRAIAYELAEYNITVNAIAGGRITTEMSATNNTFYNDLHMKLIPMKRFGSPKEVADLFSFLASDKSSYITGTTINITGGWYM